MRLKLKITKDDGVLHEGAHEVSDAKTFGEAFKNVWVSMMEHQFGKATSVGALYENLNENSIGTLDGASIHLKKADL